MKQWQQIVLGIVAFFALIVLVNEFQIAGIKFWGVRKANADREVFEQTQSYVESHRQNLIKYHHEWVNATPDDKIAIEFTIRHEFSQFSEDKYLIDNPELYTFLKNIKNK
jgi:UDP-3-O-acyl-N-acetylglucosamine deacetylase